MWKTPASVHNLWKSSPEVLHRPLSVPHTFYTSYPHFHKVDSNTPWLSYAKNSECFPQMWKTTSLLRLRVLFIYSISLIIEPDVLWKTHALLSGKDGVTFLLSTSFPLHDEDCIPFHRRLSACSSFPVLRGSRGMRRQLV